MTEYTANVEVIRRMMDGITTLRDKGKAVKQKGGKMYTMVQDRVETLRRESGDYYRIQTELIQWGSDAGALIVVRAVIRDSGGQTIATGHAEEVRGSNYINETSALENCETSAIGRALAVLGLHGGEFASADEIVIANGKRDKIEEIKKAVPEAPLKMEPSTAGAGLKIKEKEVPKKEEVAPAVVDIEEMIAEKGGKPRSSVIDHPVLQGHRPEIVDLVDTVNIKTPVLKTNSKDYDMLEECFMTFLPLCTSVDESYAFWFNNENLIKILKKEAPETFARVRDAFTATKSKLQQKDK
jgi:hypothetical protein